MAPAAPVPATDLTPVSGIPTLYHSKMFVSSVAVQFVQELGLDSSQFAIKLVGDTFTEGDKSTFAILKSNKTMNSLSPRQVLPVLVFPEGDVMCETGAIVLHMCEMYDKKNAFHPSTTDRKMRTKFLQGIVYGFAECYAAAAGVFRLCMNKTPEERDAVALKAAIEKYKRVVFEHLERELAGKDYYLGDEYSLCDVVLSYALMLAPAGVPELVDEAPQCVKDYRARLVSRESYVDVYG